MNTNVEGVFLLTQRLLPSLEAAPTPEDLGGLAIFLASRAGAFTVGEVMTCGGGIVATS